MKRIVIIAFLLAGWSTASAQNTFPTPSGNVGIGTTSPLTLLQLKKDVNTAISASYTYNDDISGIRFTNLSTVSNAGIVLNFQLGSTGTSHAAIAASRPSADHNILHFYTEHANSIAERMRINSNGNVGIGTTSPSVKLDISGSGTSTTVTRLSSGGHANYRQSRGSSSYDGGYLFYTGTTLDWRFQESANSSNLNIIDESLSTNVMTFQDNTGNVGIGTTTPASRLDIKIGSSETVRMLDFTDGNYRVGSVEKLSSNDGVGLVLSGYTKSSVTEANPTLVLKGYTKDLAPNNEYDAAVTVRGYNVEDDTELQNIPIFKVLNAHSVAHLTVAASGNVGIGTTSPDSKLAVNGTIHTKEVKVDLIGWSDFVFEDDYDLPSLTELESFISKNKHLPDVPTEAEVLENGINLGEMDATLLQKIEELTLYMIDMNKQVQQLKSENQELKEEISALKKE